MDIQVGDIFQVISGRWGRAYKLLQAGNTLRVTDVRGTHYEDPLGSYAHISVYFEHSVTGERLATAVSSNYVNDPKHFQRLSNLNNEDDDGYILEI